MRPPQSTVSPLWQERNSGENAQVLQQDLDSHQDQDDAAQNLGRRAVALAEHAAQAHAQGGQQEGDDPDERDGGDDIDLQEGEGDAHGQSVDAGGQRHR